MEEKHTIFIQKNLKKASDPDGLDEYLKVNGHGAWFVVGAAGLVLLAIFVWIFFGRIQMIYAGAGYCKDGVLTCYFQQEDVQEIKVGSLLNVDDVICEVTSVNSDLYLENDVPYDILFLLPQARWYSTVEAKVSLKDGLYMANCKQEEIKPSSFFTLGE